jgi:hypothetical protein
LVRFKSTQVFASLTLFKLSDNVATTYFEDTPFVHWSLTGFLMAVKPFWTTVALSNELLATLKKRYLTILNTIIADESKDDDQRNMAKLLSKQVLRFVVLSHIF